MPMQDWLDAALAYVPRWIEFQMRYTGQPGCVVAIDHAGRTVLDRAFGVADLTTGEALTPGHRLRVASHSKTFTAAGIMRLRERGLLGLDDGAGDFVDGLHPDVAGATIGQLLSHSAGVARDGPDSGQFFDRRPYLGEDELRADLRLPPALPAGVRFKYSNHGFGLLGLVIEAVTDRPYAEWIRHEVIAPAGLDATDPDAPAARGAAVAKGHSGPLPLGRRVVVPGDNPARAMAPAAGFAATAHDVARFFGQLSPRAERSILSPASRREMTRPHRRDRDFSGERHYGLGVICGGPGDWSWFGHSGSFQGFLSRTIVIPDQDLAVTVLTNAVDGPAQAWTDGIAHILRTFAQGGAPDGPGADWGGRWWSLWGAVDLVPVGGGVFVAAPAAPLPLLDAAEIRAYAPDEGVVATAHGFLSPGEPARRERGPDGAVQAVWIGGAKLVSEASLAAEMEARDAARVDQGASAATA